MEFVEAANIQTSMSAGQRQRQGGGGQGQGDGFRSGGQRRYNNNHGGAVLAGRGRGGGGQQYNRQNSDGQQQQAKYYLSKLNEILNEQHSLIGTFRSEAYDYRQTIEHQRQVITSNDKKDQEYKNKIMDLQHKFHLVNISDQNRRTTISKQREELSTAFFFVLIFLLVFFLCARISFVICQ